MIEFTQAELYDAIEGYNTNKDELVADARNSVVEWKYAYEEMISHFPLAGEISSRGENQWEPAVDWLPAKPELHAYEHGIDADGRIRLIRSNGIATTLFSYFDDFVDEMRLSKTRALKRYLLGDGHVVAFYEYCLRPHQYSLETFEYADGKPVKSVEKSWFIKNDEWVEASWTTSCVYERDSEGLSRVYRDAGKRGGNKLVYVRPGSGRLSDAPRRPFVAYTIEVRDDCEDPSHDVYYDAYGLEMNIDDEWEIDTVLLTAPELVDSITGRTNVLEMGTVYAGSNAMPSDLRKVKKDKGDWILLYAEEPDIAINVRDVVSAKLDVILVIQQASDIAVALNECDVTADRLVVAYRPTVDCSADDVQTVASLVRAELASHNCDDSRIVVAAKIGMNEVMDYMTKCDIDGVLHFNGRYHSTMDILQPIALHCR